MKYPIDDKSSAAVLVRKLRTELGMTQQQLADRAGVSFSFVNQVEGGKPTVRLDALNKILHVFGYTMAPSRSHHAFSAQNAWSPLQMSPPPTAAPAPVQAPETKEAEPEFKPSDSAPRKNDWTFY